LLFCCFGSYLLRQLFLGLVARRRLLASSKWIRFCKVLLPSTSSLKSISTLNPKSTPKMTPEDIEQLKKELEELSLAPFVPYDRGSPPDSQYSSSSGSDVSSYVRPELGSTDDYFIDDSTAEIAANSPRYRRRSSTFIDGVHDLPDDKASPMAPAQLYSTMSGRLFHSGRIAIVLVGPPARGKT